MPKGIRKHPDRLVDKNDPLNYIGDEYKFLEEDGYLNNIVTELHKKPRSFPFQNWQKLKGSSYHKTKWVPADKRRDNSAARRRIERDPNHAIWEPRYGLLRWWHIRISLLGSDEEGRQIVMIRKGESEPIYLRVGRIIEIFYQGKKVNLKED